ncbi:MAG: hypothetical protein JWN96_1593 [Mycobacterium sp.]|nr:hypothetical protein [Mycobacterium sp.]
MLDPMDCLRDGVPPLLLIDLFDKAGPDAEHIYVDEPAEDLSWTQPIAEDAAEVAGQLPLQEPAA